MAQICQYGSASCNFIREDARKDAMNSSGAASHPSVVALVGVA
jgi:hypothetical protein